jgi:membrane fusion protein (multidrug efflux system)
MTIMTVSFPHSNQALRTDSSRRNIVAFLFAATLVTGWAAWSVIVRVTLYAATADARLEVVRERHAVGAPVGGRVVSVAMALGQNVKAGDVLLELDAVAEHLARKEQEVRLAPMTSQIELLKLELAAEERALEEERGGAAAAIAESDLNSRQATIAAAFAADEARRLQSLHASGLVSELEALRAKTTAEERENEARSLEAGSNRLFQDFEVREQDRLAEILRLKRDVAEIEGLRGEAQAKYNLLEHNIEQRTIRAPVDGTLAEVSPLTNGTMVALGDRVCTIVPVGEVKVVAFFEPSAALGRVRTGQRAHVRLKAFPWTQYGTAQARVSNVASEPHDDGDVRVELALDRAQRSSLPIQHGLPAQVDVEVERVSPAMLVLRSVATYTGVIATQP